jgi:glutamine cyclotransferase
MKQSFLTNAIAMTLIVITSMGINGVGASAAPVDTPVVVWSKPVDIATRIAAISADGQRMLYSDPSFYLGRVRVFNVNSGAIESSFTINVDRNQGRDVIKSMHFLNDTSFMVVTQISLYVMDLRTGKMIEDVGMPATGAIVDIVVPMHNTDFLIIGAYRRLFKYDYKTKQLDTIYFSPDNEDYGHTGNIGWIGLSDDERVIYSAGSRDVNHPAPGRICAWELATGRQIYQVDEPDSVYLQAASPTVHGSFAAFLGIDKAVVFDLRTGTLVAQFYDVAKESQGVGLSKDGSIVAIHDSRRIDFYTTMDPHLFASMKAWPANNIHFLDGGATEVLIGKVDSLVQRVRLNLATSVIGDAAPRTMQCSIVPNPSTNQATMRFVLAAPSVVSIQLVSIDGRIISEHSLGLLQAGSHTEVLQAPAGHYMCTVTAGATKQSLPVVIQ